MIQYKIIVEKNFFSESLKGNFNRVGSVFNV